VIIVMNGKGMIEEKTYELLRGLYGAGFQELIISDVRTGIYLTAVSLSDGSVGTAATVGEELPFSARQGRDFGRFTPLRIRGQKVTDLFGTEKRSGLVRSLRMAVLSALSARWLTQERYNLIPDMDPIQLAGLEESKTVTVVGAFQTYIRKISEIRCRLHVLEFNREALPADFQSFFVPAGRFSEVLPVSDIVIITGQALVNGTIDGLLAVIRPGTRVIVTGPSCSIIPDILFENKVTISGSCRVTDPGLLFRVAGEGGTGYHLFEYCAKKITILNPDGA
jgi:uncharacterized protein (DUF4213/DUF364 family)